MKGHLSPVDFQALLPAGTKLICDRINGDNVTMPVTIQSNLGKFIVLKW